MVPVITTVFLSRSEELLGNAAAVLLAGRRLPGCAKLPFVLLWRRTPFLQMSPTSGA